MAASRLAGSRAAAPRFYCEADLAPGASLDLPAGAARHVQVLRLQPGAAITLFGGPAHGMRGGEFDATITAMGRQSVQVLVGMRLPVDRELPWRLQLAIAMPANERMDWLAEKATELGVSEIQPLMSERSVVRLDAQRGRRKTSHWHSIAIAACEQCGRNQVPDVREPTSLASWLQLRADRPETGAHALVLSLRPDALSLRNWVVNHPARDGGITLLCGPEGGLSASEENLATSLGFTPVSLGPRVLRSETAAIAALTLLG